MKRIRWLWLMPALLAGCLVVACGGGGQPGDGVTPTEVPTPVGTPSAEASPSPPPQATAPRTYRVQPGDTLRSIARRFRVDFDDLRAANPQITNPDHIEPGQWIVIPPRTPPATPTATP